MLTRLNKHVSWVCGRGQRETFGFRASNCVSEVSGARGPARQQCQLMPQLRG